MILELDIYRRAAVLIREFGSDATLEAAQRADALMEKGRMEGQRVWRRILAVVEVLQRTEAPASAKVH